MFSPPADDGGDTIDKYKVEWDTYSNFSSINGTGPLGTHEVLYLAGGAPFHYTITSLQIGVPYPNWASGPERNTSTVSIFGKVCNASCI